MEEPLEYYAINTTTTIERKDDSSAVLNENLAKQHFSNTAVNNHICIHLRP